MSREEYLPPLRFRALTRVYDPVIRVTTREATFKRRLLDQAQLQPGNRVLDLGCGTGTLALMAKRSCPGAELVGIDGDPEVLERAREKTATAGLEIGFDEGLSTDLPYEDRSFDRILSTLFFHHLDSADKAKTLSEITRVLKPGGELHVADWGRPSDPLMAALSWQVRLLDGIERTRENFSGALPRRFTEAGLTDVTERESIRTAFGTLCLYGARRGT